MAAVSASDFGDRTPKLVASCDPSKLDLSPVEGFLLSRIDGATPWSLLRQIGGLGPAEVDECIECWSKEGLIEFPDPRIRAAERPRLKKAMESGEVDEGELDASLEIAVETQRRILDFESKLGASYHDVLGVDLKAETKEIKKAYFKLSKEFHPDKYFCKEIGAYAKRLEVIFKRILEAYELLSDPVVRAEVEKSVTAAARAAGPQPLQGKAAGGPPRELSKLARLRARMPYRLPASFLAERQQRASDFFEVAQRSIAMNKFIEAAQTLRLAIAFDPFNEAYRDGFGIVQARAAEMRAVALTAQGDEAASGLVIDEKHFAQILKLYEEALLYHPHRPDLNDRAARAALECGLLPKAIEYVERALAHSPDVARHHVTMAMVHKARRNRGHGINELERALELEPSNEEARNLLATMRTSSKLA